MKNPANSAKPAQNFHLAHPMIEEAPISVRSIIGYHLSVRSTIVVIVALTVTVRPLAQ
jgi:hypothetical protein